MSHGLALAHTHVRLNAAQIHNVVRQRLGIADPPEEPAHRRALFGAINAALDAVKPVPVDFGALLAEQASATRLMMTIAQIVKHVDGSMPVRFLIAETETGYTLLAALWLARLFGIERHIEISPLFETAEALEHGATVLEEALRSPHYRAYLQATGRLALQFGYSDSGRYVGQLAASYLIERLRLKIGQTLAQHGVSGVEVILFDTHGESIGRGAHPGSLADRLKYLSPTASRQALNRAGLQVREESAFQGGDGYLLFGTPELALATITRIARADLSSGGRSDRGPGLCQSRFRRRLLRDGPRRHGGAGRRRRAMPRCSAHSDRRCSTSPARVRPRGRRTAWWSAARIRHPRELRAIPNNAILQQLGWCANTLQGIGAAAARHPETVRRAAAEQPALPSRDGPGDARAGAFRHRRAARGDRDARSRHLARSRRAHARPAAGREALVAWRARWSGWISGRRRSRCSAACRPIIWRCARSGRTRRAWPRARCCCMRCGWR